LHISGQKNDSYMHKACIYSSRRAAQINLNGLIFLKIDCKILTIFFQPYVLASCITYHWR